ncbi:MAG TPA: hypothetical protein VKW09_02270 [bacterium]|nr:hypothetical protein [bacterium]
MARKRYEYAAVKTMQDQTRVPELNKFGAAGYHIVATVGQLLILERKVKTDDDDADEEED